MKTKELPACVAILVLFLLSALGNLAHAQNPNPDQKQSGNYLDIGGSKIYYEECGAGPAIVLLHDGLIHAVSWDGQWSTLCRKFHVVRYDRRGYGRSDPPKAKFSPAEDLYVLLTHLNVQHATVVGCSSGGGLAIDFALDHPEMVERLLLIGPVVHGMRTSQHFLDRGQKNSAPLDKGDFRTAAENWSRDTYLIADGHEAARKKFFELLMQSPQNMKYPGEFEIRETPPAVARLSEIHVPTLILVGEADIPDVHAYCGAIEAGILGGKREVVKDAGHLIQLEAPDYVSQTITNFIEQHKLASVPAKTLETYAGQYKPDNFPVITIALKGSQLMLQLPACQDLPLFPESETKFFMVVADVQVEFIKDAAGKVAHAVIYQNGTASKWMRM